MGQSFAMMLTRSEFLRGFVGMLGVSTIAACGNDSTSHPDAAAKTCTTPTNAIGANHGHMLTVTLDDVNAGVAKTYDIMGTSLHTHSVVITAAQFAMIKSGTTVTVTSSSTAAHDHVITVTCTS